MSGARQKIVDWLSEHDSEGYALDIMRDTGLSSARVYPALQKLETSGVVVSCWEEGRSPRRRLYRLVIPVSDGGSGT